jgi:hypothetical protein
MEPVPCERKVGKITKKSHSGFPGANASRDASSPLRLGRAGSPRSRGAGSPTAAAAMGMLGCRLRRPRNYPSRGSRCLLVRTWSARARGRAYVRFEFAGSAPWPLPLPHFRLNGSDRHTSLSWRITDADLIASSKEGVEHVFVNPGHRGFGKKACSLACGKAKS